MESCFLILKVVSQKMVSRRSVRIKVMKALYAANRDSALTESNVKNYYKRSIDMAYDAYLFNLHQLRKIAEYANTDAAIRAGKLLPTEEDKNFSTKLYNNPIILSIAESVDFASILKKRKIRFRTDADLTRRFYQAFAKKDQYKEYIKQEETTNEDHIKVLLSLYKVCLKDEIFEEMVDDLFISWTDDKSLVIGAMKKTLKALPEKERFFQEHEPPDETCMDYGYELLHKTMFFDKDLEGIIGPVLKNWDMERVAIIDMILLKLALCELMYFNSIPPKVTINEYVELAKLYSTPKSKDFVNGVIDRLTKKLKKEGKIKKTGRGLVN